MRALSSPSASGRPPSTCAERVPDHRYDSFEFCQYLPIREPQYSEPSASQVLISDCVVGGLRQMVCTIHLHHDSLFQAYEVDDVSPHRALSAELVPLQGAVAEDAPQGALALRLGEAQLTCSKRPSWLVGGRRHKPEPRAVRGPGQGVTGADGDRRRRPSPHPSPKTGEGVRAGGGGTSDGTFRACGALCVRRGLGAVAGRNGAAGTGCHGIFMRFRWSAVNHWTPGAVL